MSDLYPTSSLAYSQIRVCSRATQTRPESIFAKPCLLGPQSHHYPYMLYPQIFECMSP